MWWNTELKLLRRENQELKDKLKELHIKVFKDENPYCFNPGDIVSAIDPRTGNKVEMYVLDKPKILSDYTGSEWEYELISTDFKQRWVSGARPLTLVKRNENFKQ